MTAVATSTSTAVNSPHTPAASQQQKAFTDKQKPVDVRLSNVQAAKSVADLVRTSLGPRGMDKMILTDKSEIIVTNDGATILKHLQVLHPCARMLVELSEAQDVEAGDGTTTVVVIAGALLAVAEGLLQSGNGIHPSAIAEAFRYAGNKAAEYCKDISKPIDLDNKAAVIKAASTSLNSKVVAQYALQIAAIAVDAVFGVRLGSQVDLRDIRIITRVGGTVDDMKIIPGVVLNQPVIKSADGPTRMEKARIALIQFQLSPPKTDMENQIVVTDYQQMDRILREERAYILSLVKRIKKTGCNVLLIQKSILRDAVSEMALHYLSKSKIMVVTNIERDEVEFLCKSLGCRPIADIETFSDDKLASAELVEERTEEAGGKFVVVEGVQSISNKKTCCILVRGANQVILEEAQRSLHDCLCAVRCLIKTPATIVGGGAPEIEVAVRLAEHARTLRGVQSKCVEAFADALEVIPVILAENAGLPSIEVVTELRGRHAQNDSQSGINVRRGGISDMSEEGVVQPLHVTTSAIQLAAETVSMIMKIDDIVQSR